jgi:hypothetical protein
MHLYSEQNDDAVNPKIFLDQVRLGMRFESLGINKAQHPLMYTVNVRHRIPALKHVFQQLHALQGEA